MKIFNISTAIKLLYIEKNRLIKLTHLMLRRLFSKKYKHKSEKILICIFTATMSVYNYFGYN